MNGERIKTKKRIIKQQQKYYGLWICYVYIEFNWINVDIWDF